ncbi:hypothetical protein [Pontibacter flavimaris]|uniref:Uncharacterized protein n=1 Tax=Pontibacter flavimaris TaxID=1797110 RepID=A0A1Q5PFP8_9BACT|nr:hypothetical protein [Pontibacter flavimaris]OKL41054.1 hypothetical protein A3841_14600 [Pontibacter flavimaris]
MKLLLLITLAVFCLSACSGKTDHVQNEERATVASETGQPAPLPADVIYSTKPLISGKLYSQPDFEAPSVAYFDTTQQIHILDTTHAMFAKARIRQDTMQYTGFVPKTILPEQKP